MNEPAGEQNLEGVAAEQQRRCQEILLVPHPGDVTGDVVVRQVDVVDMDDHAGPDAGQYVQEKDGDVRPLETAVRAVQEQDVAGLQRVEDRRIGVFQRFADDRVAKGVDLVAGLGIDRGQMRAQAIEFDGAAGKLGRNAGADLDESGRIVGAQEMGQGHPVQRWEPGVEPEGLAQVVVAARRQCREVWLQGREIVQNGFVATPTRGKDPGQFRMRRQAAAIAHGGFVSVVDDAEAVLGPVGTEGLALVGGGKRDFEIRANALVRWGGLSGGPEHCDAVRVPTELDQGDAEVTLDRGVTRRGCQCPAQHDLGVVQKVVAKPGDALIKLFLNGVFEFGGHAAQPRSAGLTGPAQMR